MVYPLRHCLPGFWISAAASPRATAHQLGPFCLLSLLQPQASEAIDELTGCLYLSFTNAISFAANDVIPLTRWAKPMVLPQPAVSVAAVAVVIARAGNILG